uniref:(northern house mosquito) hypothetical protein n=1 Tax=Culex pipiens TaxID=7175 RepID=A0A8D8DM07_CULPI
MCGSSGVLSQPNWGNVVTIDRARISFLSVSGYMEPSQRCKCSQQIRTSSLFSESVSLEPCLRYLRMSGPFLFSYRSVSSRMGSTLKMALYGLRYLSTSSGLPVLTPTIFPSGRSRM